MGRILEAGRSFFERDGWPYADQGGRLATAFGGEHGNYTCWLVEREQHQQMVLYAVSPTTVPPERRLAMSELLARANFGIVMGNLEMDWDDGEVRYKTSADVEGIELHDVFVRNLVHACVLGMDQYQPAVAEVAAGEEPLFAVVAVEVSASAG
jgi:hypothetical protein